MGSGAPFCQYWCRSFTSRYRPRELTEAETKKGLTLESTVVRNRLVNEHLNTALKSKPAPTLNSLLTASQLETLLTIWQKLPMSIGLSKLL
jgi:hypothetical protein